MLDISPTHHFDLKEIKPHNSPQGGNKPHNSPQASPPPSMDVPMTESMLDEEEDLGFVNINAFANYKLALMILSKSQRKSQSK